MQSKYDGLSQEQMSSKYDQKAHAIQSGVAFELGRRIPHVPEEITRELKHLRVGLNLVMRDHASMAALLIEKGVFDLNEYQAWVLGGLDDEIRAFEERLRAEYFASITLG